MSNPLFDAIIRLEKWLGGAPDFVLKADVRLVIDTLREAEDLAFELEKLEEKHERLRADVDAIDQRLRGVL